MAREKLKIIKVGLQNPEFEFIQKIANENKSNLSETVRRIIITFNIITSSPLYEIIGMKPLNFGEEEKKKENKSP